mmetsp:Transcript_22380/g.31127  ORF Transcript_22380/g.31127 Transcript_22380/m.31127 type:complete len:131 (-) Transcript_22380:246-638(-)|eukprot:CAMPEP_0196577524 /NCGR_PEP_ID=MMETSP1081-20130531/6582_1 /TAXON_ID=36882 /ORGANISM="Pyramimonas amylifera, Strain CCMP720" /LENGTH=130 /DNA_ID=CAMNT_0041896475 /DNA_START=103 /DNA_END=495 /DNA_ORIENTATION=+
MLRAHEMSTSPLSTWIMKSNIRPQVTSFGRPLSHRPAQKAKSRMMKLRVHASDGLVSPKKAKEMALAASNEALKASLLERMADAENINGRLAMLGVTAALVVEYITGLGIISQVVLYLKMFGILGPDSGF